MFGSASGPVGALLMIAPLAAIPVFAIVGVPHFAPVAASPADEEDIAEFASESPSLGEAVRPAPRRSADDFFAPVGEGRPAAESAPRQEDHSRSQPEPRSAPKESAFRETALSIAPPEALDDWEIASNLPEDSPAPGSGKTQPEIPRERREVALGDSVAQNAPASRAENRASEPEPRRPSASRGRTESLDSNRRSEAGQDRLARNFDPDLLSSPSQPEASGAAQKPRNRKRDAARSAEGRTGIENDSEVQQDHPSMPQGLPDQSGWRAAAERLRELGIRKYRLESKIENQSFLFRCEYPTPENPHVTELFEADADTPLGAVLHTLEQIDEWLESGGPKNVPSAG
jgi:hypothetical protein